MVNTPHPEYLAYSIFLLLAVMFGMMLTEAFVLERAVELIHLTVMLLTMILLLITVRILQPGYARHPVIYSYIPLIIFPFYAFFIDSPILTDITFLSIQATCLIVFSGITVTYFKSLEKGYLLFVALISFISAFMVYWLFNTEEFQILSLVHVFSGTGMIAASFIFPHVLIKNKR